MTDKRSFGEGTSSSVLAIWARPFNKSWFSTGEAEYAKPCSALGETMSAVPAVPSTQARRLLQVHQCPRAQLRRHIHLKVKEQRDENGDFGSVAS